ncbi:MAG: flagellar biosynthetic protein FliO [Myxococcaceae bacterium]|nr:flagellar biosynthetic protein FliO [Myxococcaceae bacterium]
MRAWLLAAALVVGAAAQADDAGAQAGATVEAAAPSLVIPEPEIPKSEPPDLVGEDLNLGWALVRTIVVLGIVVALAWLTLNVGLRKLMGLGPAAGRRGLVTVLERVPLDQKRSLYVIKAGDEVILLGSSELNLSFLTKLDPKVLAALEPVKDAPQMSPFLQKLLGRKDAPPPAGPPPASS